MATIPQQLINALELVQQDFEDLAAKNAAAASAAAAAAAAKQKLLADQAALIKLIEEIYSGAVVGIVVNASPPVQKT